MDQKENSLLQSCSFSGIRPAMADLPYPPVQVREPNPAYANLLSIDYCGSVSELSAITQYINNENRLSGKNCPMARTLLGIAIAEMMHLQHLGQLICLLGGQVDFIARMRNGNQRMWTPDYLTIPAQTELMLKADMESEQAAINQYEMHRKLIKDDCVDAVLKRIIVDEEYHIMLLRDLQKNNSGHCPG